MEKTEIVELFDRFINEFGMFNHFKKWIEDEGYTLDEIGIKDDED